MKNVVISGTGLFRPPHVITNAELVQAFNAYADLQNDRNAARIAAGELPAMVHSSVEFIEKPRASSSAMCWRSLACWTPRA
jgi:beta-ketodecanoyl-[acyl-carrier-protein] synthase